MRINILLLAFVMLMSCKQAKQKLIVSEITDGMEVTRGYVILATDSVFRLDQKQYLIKTREFFSDEGEVTHVMIWGVLGYEDWPKKAFSPITHFLEDYQMSPTASTYLMDNQRLIINGDTAIVKRINSNSKMIYYNLKRDQTMRGPKHLYRITYR